VAGDVEALEALAAAAAVTESSGAVAAAIESSRAASAEKAGMGVATWRWRWIGLCRWAADWSRRKAGDGHGRNPILGLGCMRPGWIALMGLILNFRPTVLNFLFLFLDILNRLDDRLGTPNRD
jgi:hypothetical protein